MTSQKPDVPYDLRRTPFKRLWVHNATFCRRSMQLTYTVQCTVRRTQFSKLFDAHSSAYSTTHTVQYTVRRTRFSTLYDTHSSVHCTTHIVQYVYITIIWRVAARRCSHSPRLSTPRMAIALPALPSWLTLRWPPSACLQQRSNVASGARYLKFLLAHCTPRYASNKMRTISNCNTYSCLEYL